ncbi:glutamate--cysteine ligase regulatory subunit [Euwallacea fornicatus]|uniref:glutamate--cysteine ligase regulatory subunit n=1 Tax=Euwallacea fornicatus TaxID=995702 RepID=UPI00338D7545
MGSNGLDITSKTILSTGNIMSINDITKKPSQSSTQELIDAIKYTLKEYTTKNLNSTEQADHFKIISRPEDDVQAKIQENRLEELKIGLKVFLTDDNEFSLRESLEIALHHQLKVSSVADVIVCCKKSQSVECRDDLSVIKNIWKILESYVDDGSVGELGVADIEEGTFRELYEWAKVKPVIIQINLATCCVVPPTLQTFCKEKNIKLFTHSDSSDILPDQSIEEIFSAALDLAWAVRFTVHIKCRGVLTTKGYCLCLNPRLKK